MICECERYEKRLIRAPFNPGSAFEDEKLGKESKRISFKNGGPAKKAIETVKVTAFFSQPKPRFFVSVLALALD